MNFDWDEAKNEENIRKHGLDFLDAWELFVSPALFKPSSVAVSGDTCALANSKAKYLQLFLP